MPIKKPEMLPKCEKCGHWAQECSEFVFYYGHEIGTNVTRDRHRTTYTSSYDDIRTEKAFICLNCIIDSKLSRDRAARFQTAALWLIVGLPSLSCMGGIILFTSKPPIGDHKFLISLIILLLLVGRFVFYIKSNDRKEKSYIKKANIDGLAKTLNDDGDLSEFGSALAIEARRSNILEKIKSHNYVVRFFTPKAFINL